MVLDDARPGELKAAGFQETQLTATAAVNNCIAKIMASSSESSKVEARRSQDPRSRVSAPHRRQDMRM